MLMIRQEQLVAFDNELVDWLVRYLQTDAVQREVIGDTEGELHRRVRRIVARAHRLGVRNPLHRFRFALHMLYNPPTAEETRWQDRLFVDSTGSMEQKLEALEHGKAGA